MVKETATAIDAGFKPIGYSNFVRTNPLSDRFKVNRFHHVEFWCTDATNTARRFSWGLGMPIVAKSALSTGNATHASYLLRSGDLRFLFTAPYSPSSSAADIQSTASIPTFSHDACRSFSAKHGLGVRAIGIEVEDADVAFRISVAHGGRPSAEPVVLDNHTVLAEVHLYGDVVLRYVSYKKESASGVDGGDASWFFPNFEKMDESSSFPLDYGIRRLDHAVGNVEELGPAVSYVKGFTGFHEFAEFTAEDVGTSESGLNSVVLANNEEMVLLPMNEPVYGTKRKSQIQTYLEHNEGAGVQHLALMSEDIFRTLREMRKRSSIGAFEFMPSPPPTYYRNLKNRAGDVLSDEQIKQCEELGILVDRDDQGTLLQIFTKPLGDRPTFFIEIIQRVGCMFKDDTGKEYQKGGCGGFGMGNFSELFKSVEEYKTLETKRIVETGTELKPLVSRRGKKKAGSSTSHHAIIMPEHEPNPEWVTSVAEKIKQEPKKLSRSAGKSSCCIFRVPQSLVEINDKAYQPHIVSIGPYHYGKLHLQTVQEHKGRFLGEARARAEKHGVGFNEFFKAVATDEERIRECYAETIEYSSREFVEMMMLDGCFIVELFCIVGRIVETNQDDPLFNVPWMFFSLMRDLLRFENQVPFFVLQSLYKVSILSSGKQDLPSLTKLALKFFNYGIQRPDEVLSSCNELEGNHLLDLFRSTLIPPPQDQSGSASEFLQFIPSARKLRKAGIRFKPRNSPASFLDIKFSDGFLEIPHLTVDDNITSLLLNCIAYEQCYGHCSNHITSYISFMTCLINTPMDAGFLSDRRVIENYFGTDEEVQKFFCNVGREVMFDIQKSYLAKVFEDVNEYYRNNWHVNWAGFKHTYFNSPWSFMSALAALLILIFTITQSFFAAYAYAYFRPPPQH